MSLPKTTSENNIENTHTHPSTSSNKTSPPATNFPSRPKKAPSPDTGLRNPQTGHPLPEVEGTELAYPSSVPQMTSPNVPGHWRPLRTPGLVPFSAAPGRPERGRSSGGARDWGRCGEGGADGTGATRHQARNGWEGLEHPDPMVFGSRTCCGTGGVKHG